MLYVTVVEMPAETGFELLLAWFGQIPRVITNTVVQLHSLMPDSLLFGSLLLYFLTHNLSFGVFAVFIFEVVMSHRFIGWMVSQSVAPSPRLRDDVVCRAGFKTPQFDAKRIFLHDPYPSYGVFSISAIATYLGLATNEFAETRKAMGSQWASRGTVAYVFIALLVLAFIIVRVYVSDCGDTMGEVMVAALAAMIVGYVFFTLNKSLFGTEAMNFLGLPYLKEKAEKGSAIYVCSTVEDKQ